MSEAGTTRVGRGRWMGAVGLALVGGGLLVAKAWAKGDLCCSHDAHAQTNPAGPLAPWEPVSAAFLGCQSACGMGHGQKRDDARIQPGAATGDYTYCPVSGALFRISDKSPRLDVDGHPLFFCCDACASYFTAHEAEVLARRAAR
jgi:hypothetical protein